MGFKKLFRDASDQRFDEAVEMIKYVLKRGGNVKQALSIEVSCRAHRWAINPRPAPLGVLDFHALLGGGLNTPF